MANTKNIMKKVKGNKPNRNDYIETAGKIPSSKIKMREDSKQAKLIKLLERSNGATIDEMVKSTGWQRHSIRGMMSGVLKKRLGLSIASEKDERGRMYRIVS